MSSYRDAAWRRRFEASPPELQRVMVLIAQTERAIAELERQNASVGELLPLIRRRHDLEDREVELRGHLRRAGQERGTRPA